MGVPDEKIFSILSHLRQQKNYTSVGEVQRALDILNKEQQAMIQKEQIQINQLLRTSQSEDVELQETIQISKLQAV